jgi:Asp-tRNA(Asn)/Glu-tRNA(Gln) amidotransferase A subunit family amidase
VLSAFSARDASDAAGRELREDDVEATTWALVQYARTVTGTDYVAALCAVHDVAFSLGSFFRTYDVLLTPVLANPPLPLGTFDMNRMTFDEYMTKLYVEHMPFTRQFNFSGGPAMSIPMHMTEGRLPIGVQFGADVGREDILFRLAAQIEVAKPWKRIRPPLPLPNWRSDRAGFPALGDEAPDAPGGTPAHSPSWRSRAYASIS